MNCLPEHDAHTEECIKYAVMVRTQYTWKGPYVWVTHSVEDTREAAALEACKFGFYDSCVRVYHSREWEQLVR